VAAPDLASVRRWPGARSASLPHRDGHDHGGLDVLERKLSRLIRTGRLTISGLRRGPVVLGAVSPASPHLDVAVRVKGRLTAAKIALRPELYFGEAFMDRSLEMERGTLWDLLALCGENFAGRSWIQVPRPLRRVGRVFARAAHQTNSLARARRNSMRHYDLPDLLFEHFLDADRHYSCAYFRSPDQTLEQAQTAKVQHIAAKLLLRPGMRVLDIGCGWGGLAMSLARLAGVQVTGITLSQEQAMFAARRVKESGLGDCVDIARKDYREMEPSFDRIVSVGMFEHVGVPYYRVFFDTIARLLAPDGVALVHTIGRTDGPGATGGWTRKYIFPGGYVPALSEVLPRIEQAGLWVSDVEVLRLHYAETLRHWRHRFLSNRAAVLSACGERFCRMWEFFLATSEMGFRYGNLVVFQIQLAKHVGAVPITRDYMVAAESALRAADAGSARSMR
jgi:cyclopropane-fatty-acyl-phospholipid synthase